MIILVTGTSSGFGKAIKAELERCGHIVYGTSRRGSDNPADRTLQLEVRNPENCQQVVDYIVNRHGQLDVLINNAGFGLGGAVELTSPDDFRLQMDTNFFGCVNMCRAALPVMRAQRRGRILNFSSIAGRFAIPFQGPYSCSKFAIEAFSESLVLETAQFGIDVLCIEPGDFSTGFTAARLNSEASAADPDYSASYARVRKNYEDDETIRGAKPEYLARRVARLVEAHRTSFHNVITPNPVQHLSVFLSRIVPTKLFLRIIAKFYNV